MTNAKISRRTLILYSTLLPIYLWHSTSKAADSSDAQAKWNQLTPEKQELVRKRWTDFKAMPRERRDQLRAAMQRFAGLSPESQEHIRENWKSWKSFSPQQREEIRKNYARFQAMTPEKRAALNEKYQDWKKQNDESKKKK
jgi:thioesterase domain-containing protein